MTRTIFRMPRWSAGLATVGLLALSGCTASQEADESSAGSSVPTTTSAEVSTSTAGTSTAGVTTSSDEPAAETGVATDADEPGSDGGVVDVVTTYFGYDPGVSAVLIGGYASGVIEDGGTCTATLAQGGRTVTATSVGAADVRTTACPEIRIAGSQLGSGSWSVVLTYSSPRATGTAEAVTVDVP